MKNKTSRRDFLKQTTMALTAVTLPLPVFSFSKFNAMNDIKKFDVIIVGGSYAGLSAAMTLGRSLRNVLIIDSGNPCNKQTPYSHNFITNDGQKPKEINQKAKKQVLKYDTVKFYSGLVTSVETVNNEFEIVTQSKDLFKAKKVLFATGITDVFPNIKGFSECWGISVLHCPYCHGYEVKQKNIGLIANGDAGFDLVKLITNWSSNLTLFTNGKSTLNEQQIDTIKKLKIEVIEKEIETLHQTDGIVKSLKFIDGTEKSLEAIFARIGFKQHCNIPKEMGCELTDQGHIKVDDFHRTTVKGVYAAGDNTTFFRSVSVAVAAGTKAGAFINKELIDDVFF